MIDLLIVDDHKIIRDGVKGLLRSVEDIRIVGECSDGSEVLIALKEKENVDIVLMDLSMPGMGGIEATEKVLREFPDMKIVAFTMHDDPSYFDRFKEVGGVGYLLKNTDKLELVDALRRIHSGERYF